MKIKQPHLMNSFYTNRIKVCLENIPAALLKLKEEDLTHRPAPNKWSKKEIFGHLIDSARVNLQRYLEIQHSPSPYIVQRYFQDELVQLNDYQNMPTVELIQLWKSLNQQIVSIYEKADESVLAKTVEIPHEGATGNFKFMMDDYVDHLEHHLKQIVGELNFSEKKKNRQVSVEEAMQYLGDDTRFAKVLEHGTMIVEIYQPIEHDPQSPHAQDELYIVISGSGEFYNDGITKPFQTGDVLFVPAGVEHRFEKFTEDFKTWVIFYGAIGGEL